MCGATEGVTAISLLDALCFSLMSLFAPRTYLYIQFAPNLPIYPIDAFPYESENDKTWRGPSRG